jgi:F0F1-type ATP synthase assembly protein I
MDREPHPPTAGRPRGEPSAGGKGGLAVAGLGFQFAASLLLFYYAGQWLDRRLGTAPVFLLVGVFVGAGASFFVMYKQLMAAQRREEEARRTRAADDGRTPGAPGGEAR